MSRPERRVPRADPVKEAALAAKLRDYRPDSHKKPAVWDDVFDCLGELADPVQRLFAAGDQFSKTKSRSSVGGVSAICGSYHIETCRTLPTAYVKYDV